MLYCCLNQEICQVYNFWFYSTFTSEWCTTVDVYVFHMWKTRKNIEPAYEEPVGTMTIYSWTLWQLRTYGRFTVLRCTFHLVSTNKKMTCALALAICHLTKKLWKIFEWEQCHPLRYKRLIHLVFVTRKDSKL